MIRNPLNLKSVFSILILGLTLFTNIADAQNSNSIDEKKSKAEEIFQKSRKAIGLETEKLNVRKISLNYTFSNFTKEFIVERKEERAKQGSGEREIHTILPNKFKFVETMNSEDTVWVNNYILADNLLNEESYGMWEGKRYENDYLIQRELTREQAIKDKKEEIFFILFPILLQSKDFYPFEFKFVTKADVNGEKLDVLEATLSEESKTRLFFDEKTHLLKMIITNSDLPNGAEIEEKRFYSDYNVVDGLKIAHKINVELKQTSKRLSRESIEEQIIKSAKINPTFKPNFFEVKKR